PGAAALLEPGNGIGQLLLEIFVLLAEHVGHGGLSDHLLLEFIRVRTRLPGSRAGLGRWLGAGLLQSRSQKVALLLELFDTLLRPGESRRMGGSRLDREGLAQFGFEQRVLVGEARDILLQAKKLIR